MLSFDSHGKIHFTFFSHQRMFSSIETLHYFFVCFFFRIYRTPYNQNSTIGHVFTHVIQTTGISSLVAYLCAITTMYFGVCSYFKAFFHDLAYEHEKIDDEYGLKSMCPKEMTIQQKAIEMRKRFIELIELHNIILEYNIFNYEFFVPIFFCNFPNLLLIFLKKISDF